MFADHAFDLQHNNGTMFGKHGMILLNERRLRLMLEIKKSYGSVRDLWHRLRGHYSEVSSHVTLLFESGQDRSIW